MWEFDILSSATTQAIPPCDPDSEDDELNNALPPVDLHQATDCNCFNMLTNPACLVDIHKRRMLEDEEVEHVDISAVNGETEPGAGDVKEMEEIQQLTEILDMDDNEDDEDIDDQLESEQNRNGNTAIDVMYPEKFVVVGSWQEGRYQSALAICMWRRSANKQLVFKVEHESDNIRDTNALKFMVFHNEKWHIIGYCGPNKIPKLKRALHRNEVHSISLDSLKRTFAYREKKLLYSASLVIVKRGLWDKDDRRNHYNSCVDC